MAKKQIYLTCKDCGYGAANAVDFSDHAHECAVNPVPWKTTQDYLDKRKAEENN